MNDIRVFENQEFGKIRTVVRNNEPWFVAADVCRALDLGNPTKALMRLDDDEKALTSIQGISRGNDQTNIVNEPGLYALVLGSRKPEARAFKRWITHEVIPSIRKTGQYRAKPDEKERLQAMRAEAMLRNAKAREAALWVKLGEMLSTSEHKQLCASYSSEVLSGRKVIPLPEVEQTYNAEEVGRMCGISAQMVGRLANQNGLKTEKYGHLVLDKSRYSNKEVETWRYNQAGAEQIRKLVAK